MKSGYSLLYRYMLKEVWKNFIAAFLFFFAVFFVNSILLLVQKILLKNISLSTMLVLVLLYMPQFLVFTFPFAALSSSSMVLGDMASTNELLALRSIGIPRRKIYFPLIAVSLFLSVLTFLTADVLHPYSSRLYKEKLAEVMADYPTLEIESNAVNTIGEFVLRNGKAEGGEIEDALVMTKGSDGFAKTAFSPKGAVKLADPYYFVYSLDLETPSILISDSSSPERFASASAEKAEVHLDFSSQLPSLTSNSPVNLTSGELLEIIGERNEINDEDKILHAERKEGMLLEASSALKKVEKGKADPPSAADVVLTSSMRAEALGDDPSDYYGQYYKSELAKKFALSLPCFFLTLFTLPLSNMKLKHGKLTGFAISILTAVAYWYMLFASQLVAFDFPISPYLSVMAPNLILGLVAVLMLYRKGKAGR